MALVTQCGATCAVISGIESRMGTRSGGQRHWRSGVQAEATQHTPSNLGWSRRRVTLVRLGANVMRLKSANG
jgi:hypothetical protein